MPGETARALTRELNRTCFCVTLDCKVTAKQILAATGEDGFFAAHIASRPHLFSGVPVFLPPVRVAWWR
ncbi:MAG: hypothetical protein ACLFV8_14290 [Alphaproteobacteria bacterium]